ncbi:uncharacterized protein LOC112099434 [Citrus clementina]|uniref:uncharacterized protein LOC112099434 n=1 Tax=Citrus clementina TaxID=85681 RepID=UPI000CECF53C|nr:uncharacterized protein LOC112099434 [Citrus x clementina]
MLKLGFSNKWVELIMGCITTTSFSVLINGVPKGLIQPQRGLRQGCPLSPYLFILCAEVFSNLLMQAESQRLIHGLKFGNNITISHLLFADDSLIFARASKEDCVHLKGIFDCYATTSGQIFNFDKSSIFFSHNVKADQISTIKNLFKLKVVSKHERYLGLPSLIGRKKKSFFNEIKLKILSKISSWEHKCFSSGGKEVLIKAVAQAVPAYAMSVFKLPVGTCNDIQKVIARYWWGSKEDKRAIHWASWHKLSQAKSRGGLGFRDLSSFNQALVAKQGWRIIQNSNSLVAKVLQAKYFKHGNFFERNRRLKTFLYLEEYFMGPLTFKPISVKTLPSDTTVSELITNDNRWKEALLFDQFVQEDADAIMNIPLPRNHSRDQVIWHYDRKGEYSVKSGYQIALKMKVPDTPSSSVNNNNQSENIFHALVECKAARKTWEHTKFAESFKDMVGPDMLTVFQELVKKMSKTDFELLAVTCWTIWTARNKLIFEAKKPGYQMSVATAEALLEAYQRVKPSGLICGADKEKKTAKAWLPPPPSWFKVNVDAAIRKEKNLSGLGAVIRDATGNIIAAAVKTTRFHGNVSYAEAEAVRWGLQVAVDAGLTSLIIETDSQMVADLINNRKGSKNEIYWLLQRFKTSLRISTMLSAIIHQDLVTRLPTHWLV